MTSRDEHRRVIEQGRAARAAMQEILDRHDARRREDRERRERRRRLVRRLLLFRRTV